MAKAKSTILIVDKERILVDLLTRALSSEELTAIGTTSADEAMRLVDLHEPALVVVDPTVTNGFVLLDSILKSNTKVLAVSGSEDVTQRIRAANVRDVVDRSAGLEEFVAAIRRLIEAPFTVMGRGDGTRVLIVDDEEEIRNVLNEFLTSKGYFVRTGKTGKEAVKHVTDDPTLQVVLLDVSMPEMGGLEALSLIMGRERHPSVIMMTAVADREVARQALKTGAFDYILKPFDFASVETSIVACLSYSEYQSRPWWKRLTMR